MRVIELTVMHVGMGVYGYSSSVNLVSLSIYKRFIPGSHLYW